MSPTLPARRRLAIAFAFCSLAMLTLVANHPAAGGPTFPEPIRAEARNQFMDGLVHGGFIVILSALIVCFVFLSRWLGLTRVAVIVGFVSFCMGCGALISSMILDGLVIPAIAVRFAAVVNAGDSNIAKALFVFCGTVIGILMPMGLLFQAAAMLS